MASTTRWGTGRTEAFSDGVLAIAITLLVLELAVPEQKFDNLWRGIASQWPSYLAYVTSFLTIGGIWISHHGMFARLAFVSRRLVQLNLVLLMTVSFLPFPTKLVAEAMHAESSERVAVIFYGAVLLTISLIVTAMWRTIATSPELLEPGVEVEEVAGLGRHSAPNLAFYAVVMLAAIIVPQLAAFGYLAIAIAAVLQARGGDPGAGEEPRSRHWRRHRGDAEDPPS